MTEAFQKQIEQEARQAVTELLAEAKLKKGDVFVVGCSSSEIVGGHIGKDSSLEAARAVYAGIAPVLAENGIWLAAQCCEHLNRAIIIEREAAEKYGWEEVCVVPRPHAGGSWATTCWKKFREPVAVEEIRAHAGIDIGGTAVKIGVVDENGKVLLSETRSVSFDGYKTSIMTTVANLAGEVLEKSPVKIEGIGVSATGQIDVNSGTVIGVGAQLGDWLGSPVKKILEDRFHLPVTVINDANAAALGEQTFGRAKGKENVLVVTVGTGIGGGIIENGRLIQGRRGIGGEIGHYIINFDGVECPCGNRGCFERYGSTGALVRRFTENVALLEKLGVPAEDVNGKVIFDHLDDADVSATVNSWIDSIAFGIIGLVHIFNPEMVLIGGGISREDEHFIRPLREKILNGAMEQFAKDLEVEAAALGNNAGLLGACAYFRQNF